MYHGETVCLIAHFNWFLDPKYMKNIFNNDDSELHFNEKQGANKLKLGWKQIFLFQLVDLWIYQVVCIGSTTTDRKPSYSNGS